MKTIILTITAIAFFGCANGQWNTGSKITDAALTSAQAALTSEILGAADKVAQGSDIKTALVQSTGDALRSLEATAVTSSVQPVLEAQLTKWVPKTPRWQGYAHKIGAIIGSYVQKHGNNPAVVNAALEAAATTLNNY